MNNHALQNAWTNEYKRKGIPSSFRKDPTKPLVDFITWCKKQDFKTGTAADIGCGQGRNSFYLAMEGYHVVALDLLQENVDLVNNEAKKRNLSIKAYAQDVSSQWPIQDHILDMAVDIFCYKHVIEENAQRKYRKELWRTLKPEGYYFISLASELDGFYGPLLDNSPDIQRKVIVDPHSKIASHLYSQHDLISEFSDFFQLVEASERRSTSPMYGSEYERVVLNCIFKRRIV